MVIMMISKIQVSFSKSNLTYANFVKDNGSHGD